MKGDAFFDQFYAKSDGTTTLFMHTVHVVTAANDLISKLPLSENEQNYWLLKIKRCAILHDIGKIHQEFQKRLRREEAYPIRHEIISLWFCLNFLELPKDELFAIATHHKGIIDQLSEGRLEIKILTKFMEDLYERQKDLLTIETLKRWLQLFSIDLPFKDNPIEKKITKEFCQILNSSYQYQAFTTQTERKNLSLARALLMAADHIGSARKESSIPAYQAITLEDFQPQKENRPYPFRPFQERLRSIKTDAILHAPTGSGKTEAALNWVHANQSKNARLFYLLPYTASINAMVNRLIQIYGPTTVTALHSKTLDFFYQQISDENSNFNQTNEAIENEARSRKSMSAELFYPVKVATLHQILKTALKGKGWEFSLLDYQNALFIIDEFHTYDALLTGLLLGTIKIFRKLFNAKFLFMSATIPDFMLRLITEHIFDRNNSVLIRPDKAKEQDREIMEKKRHQLYCLPDQTISDNVSTIKDYLKEGRSVLIIANNVKTAQKLFKDIEFDGTVQLLHSGFNKEDRTRIEQLITNNNITLRPQLLIATQAIEVSLDIDYDIAFIENAPIDALIQRFGRVNRAGNKRITPLYQTIDIFNNSVPVYLVQQSIGNTPFYDGSVLKDTWHSMKKLNNRELSEDDLISVCNEVYQSGYNENQLKDFKNGLEHPTIMNFESEWIAGHWKDWVDEIIANKNKKIEVLCSNLQEEYNHRVNEKLYIEANQLLVQVYFYEVESLSKIKHGNTLCANNLSYDPRIGYYSNKNSFDDRSL
jgi:CRISPR-associated endonuclease/helicase Cas3